MYPIVNILCSPPAMNTHSRKWNITIQDPIKFLDDNALNVQYFFALPNTMDNHRIVWAIQGDSTSYDLQYLDEENIAEWRKMKAKEVREKQMSRIRRRVELLNKLKEGWGKRTSWVKQKVAYTGGIWSIGTRIWD